MKDDSQFTLPHSRLIVGVTLVAAALFIMVIFLVKSSFSIASSLYNGETGSNQQQTAEQQTQNQENQTTNPSTNQ